MSLTPFTETKILFQEIKGINVFYRAAGPLNAPVILLLHGFPSSSFQYRNLITKLAIKYRVIAPDFPGFGFTEVPNAVKNDTSAAPAEFQYTFESIANVIINFTHALKLEKFGIYVFDYGAPVGFRLALERPDAISFIISQNGNTFDEGLASFWDVIRKYWNDHTPENRAALKFLTVFETTKSQYTTGEAFPERIPPETYFLDQTLMDRPGNADIQLDLFYDYRKNVALYPKIHEYLRSRQPPLLAVWGKNDIIFSPAGAEAFKTILPKAEVHLIDGGHFVLENHLDEVVVYIKKFLEKNGI